MEISNPWQADEQDLFIPKVWSVQYTTKCIYHLSLPAKIFVMQQSRKCKITTTYIIRLYSYQSYYWHYCFQADVIVNSTALQMSLKDGKVSTALSNKAGYSLQAECTRKAPLNIGDVIDTDGYGLDCEKVLHVSCPLWSKGSSEKVLFFCMLGNLISNNNLVVFSLKYYWTFTTKTTISTTNPRKNL